MNKIIIKGDNSDQSVNSNYCMRVIEEIGVIGCAPMIHVYVVLIVKIFIVVIYTK